MGSTLPTRFLCALGLASLCGRALGQDGANGAGPDRPRTAERVVKVFDFEERLTSPLDVPQGWVRAQHDELVPRIRPGFPLWNEATLDYTVAYGGEGSVRLSVEGGSASLRLKPGEAPIFPLGEYAVRAMVRTEGLGSARPRVVVRALDARGEPVPGAERVALLRSPGGEWQPVEVRLPGLFREAAFLQIDLELVQAREYADEALGDHQIWRDDFDGVAWFDEVAIVQLPQVSLSTGAPLNVVTLPARPEVRFGVRDLAAEDLLATLRLYDSDRRVVDIEERRVETGHAEWTWRPDVQELGWYRAVAEVRAGETLISSVMCDLAWLDAPLELGPTLAASPDGAEESADELGAGRPTFIELTELPPGSAGELASALRAAGASTVWLPIWEGGLREDELPERVERLREIAAAARGEWVDAAFSLPEVPARLAASLSVGRSDVLGALASEESGWGPYLLHALDRLGTTSAEWQLGGSGDASVARRASLDEDVAGVRSMLGAMVPGVEISLGSRLDAPDASFDAAGVDGVAIELPWWMPSAPMEAALAPWSEGSPEPRFVLAPMPSDVHSERAVAADLARRTVELWRAATAGEAEGVRAGIRDPWRIEPGERPVAHPTPALAAWRGVSDRLRGREFAVEWALVRGARCLVFAPSAGAPERGGLLVAWNETAPPEESELVATLGPGPVRVYDIYGNAKLVEPTGSGDGSRREHRIALGPEPVFIEGFNTGLVLFLTSIGLDPAQIHSVAGEHEHAIRVRNPWSVPAVGELVVVEPGGYDPTRQARDRTWDVTPRTMAFDLGPGEEATFPVVLSFSRATEAGTQMFVFDVRVASDENYGWVRARASAELAWDDVWMDLTFRPAERGRGEDLVIEATITNTGAGARTFEAIAAAPGMGRVRASIGTLEPGRSVVRRFHFAGGYDALAGERVMVSLTEPDGPGRITKGIEIPE